MNIDELVAQLTAASDAYYNSGEPIMTDDDYDALEAMLQNLDPSNPFLLGIGSETRGDKIELPVTMGSLDQVKEGEMVKWIHKEQIGLINIFAGDKLDGNSILLVYSDAGDLQIAYTRGDGIKGLDVTRHVRKMDCVPKTSVVGCRFVVAEVIMADEVFENIKKYIELDTGKEYKNPRNFVAGQMNKKVSIDLFYANVDVVAFGLRDSGLTKTQQYARLEENGFIIPGFKVFLGEELNDDMLADHLDGRHADSIYALDGIVLDIDDVAICDKLQAARVSSTLNPAYSKKFKVGQADNVAVATVVNVEWKVSKDGMLKPRVEIEPVDLVGVTIRYATGFNAKFIVDNLIGPGAEITITRSGDVIPFIKGVVTPAIAASIPDKSFGPYDWTAPNDKGEQVDFILDEVEDNDRVKEQRLKQFFDSMGVEFLSTRGLEKLFEAGFTTPESIITAPVNEIQEVVGESNGRKGMASLADKLKNVKPWLLAGSHSAFGRGIGRRKMKKVFEMYGRVLDLNYGELTAVEGIEYKTAQKIVDGEEEYKEFLDAIDCFYSFDDEQEVMVTVGALVGMKFAFTGYRDKDANVRIEELGGEVQSGVKKDTTHLVAKDPNSGSAKLKKAEEKGITVIGPDELWKLLD